MTEPDDNAAGDSVDARGFKSILGRKEQLTSNTPIYVDAHADEYNMKHERRGIAVIVNNRIFESKTHMPERSGTEVDASALQSQLKQLEFEVFVFHNVSRLSFGKIIKDASLTSHENCDCFCMVILTHGEEGILYMTDGTVNVNDVFEPFKGYNCSTLIGKPKLFFIQACRGTKLDAGVIIQDELEMADAEVPKIPSEADFLVAYSVVPGYFSWRNSAQGSWFAQALNNALQKYGQTTDLLTILTRVNKQVAYDFESNATRPDMNNKKQIPCITSMLTKDVYFRPKTSQ